MKKGFIMLAGIALAVIISACGIRQEKSSDNEDNQKMEITEERYSEETENETWQDAYKNIICNIESNLIFRQGD